MLKNQIQQYADHEIRMLAHTMLLEGQQTQEEHMEIERQIIIDRLKRQVNISVIWENSK
jgi:hypothetical protein